MHYVDVRRLSVLSTIALSIVLATGCTNGSEDEMGTGRDGGSTDSCDSPQTLDRFAIDSDRTLAGCYEAPDGLEVGSDTVLTLQAGTVLKFGEDSEMHVNRGSLKSTGTPSEPVLITGTTTEAGWWKGIRATSPVATVELEHTVVEYGGQTDSGGNANFAIEAASEGSGVAIDNTTFRHSGAYGLKVDDAHVESFSNNTLTQNAKGAASIDVDDIAALDAGSQYSGNDRDVIAVTRGPVESQVTWPTVGVPFRVEEEMSIKDGGFVTIRKGNTFRFAENVMLDVNAGARLTASGTSEAPIVFRGIEQTKGWWNGIRLESDSSDNVLEHVTIADAGGESEANLVFYWNGHKVSATLNDVSLKNGSKAGISTHKPENATARGCSNLSVEDCANDAVINDSAASLSEFQTRICK
jgi:hypothetical protein